MNEFFDYLLIVYHALYDPVSPWSYESVIVILSGCHTVESRSDVWIPFQPF